MPQQLKATSTYEGRMKFSTVSGSGKIVKTDYCPPLGDGSEIMPLELLLASLSACSGGSVAPLLGKLGCKDLNITVTATGTRADTHPTLFTDIQLEFSVSGTGVTKELVEKAVKLSEDKICPVWAMLKPAVKITSVITIK